MGQAQSSSVSQKNLVVSEETVKSEFFSNVFMRLIKSSDILDIRALTSGPGACGNYVILLQKNLEKDFKKIRLQTGQTNASALDDFLYASSKSVLTQSPSDQVACRYLAIFYIRVLQLVAALTMSIYSPPDLVSRIRNRVYEASLKLQKRGIKEVLSKNEQTARQVKREMWLMDMMVETEKTNIYTLGDKTQFQYNKVTHGLVYQDGETDEFKLRLEVKEQDEYTVSKKLLTDNTYWIEITNDYKDPMMKDKKIVFRSLVDGNGGGWMFSSEPDYTAVEEEPFSGYYNDWSMDLEAAIINNNVVLPTPVLKKNTSYNYRQQFVQRPTKRNTGRNGSKALTRRNTSVAQKEKNAQNSLNLGEQSTLPPRFRDSYRGMTKWLIEIPNWTEASPSTYRATLMYNKPPLPTTPGTTYACVDKWANISLRNIAPFAALETLLYDKDDGTATTENSATLKSLANAFNKIYRSAPLGNIGLAKLNRTVDIIDFDSVYTPAVGDFVEKTFCVKRTAQGDAVVEQKYAEIMSKAQDDLIRMYKEHLEECHKLLKSLFVMEKVGSENVIKFANNFINAKAGARNELEDNIIPTAITLIANHYIEIETKYFDTLTELSKVK